MSELDYTVSKAMRSLDDIEKKLPSALRVKGSAFSSNPQIYNRQMANASGRGAAKARATAVNQQRASGNTFAAAGSTKNPLKRFRLNRQGANQTNSAGDSYSSFRNMRNKGMQLRATTRP